VRPGDPAYVTERSVHNAAIDRWPALIVYRADAAGVIAAGVFVNVLGQDEADRTGEAYPPTTYARLAALKRRYDPANLFRHIQNIQPAGQ